MQCLSTIVSKNLLYFPNRYKKLKIYWYKTWEGIKGNTVKHKSSGQQSIKWTYFIVLQKTRQSLPLQNQVHDLICRVSAKQNPRARQVSFLPCYIRSIHFPWSHTVSYFFRLNNDIASVGVLTSKQLIYFDKKLSIFLDKFVQLVSKCNEWTCSYGMVLGKSAVFVIKYARESTCFGHQILKSYLTTFMMNR